MNMKNIFCSLLVASFLGACSGNGYEQMTDGIIVKIRHPYPQSARLLRFQVMGEKLIHVSATPEDEFTDKKSLIIVPQEKQTPFQVRQSGDTISVITKKLMASVLSSTGEVWFADEAGNIILRENKGGGKTFTPIEIEGKKGYSIRQVFESPDDEAFYGLGQFLLSFPAGIMESC